MKRNERTTYNSLRKTVTADTINVEIPVGFTHEARQAIHELLTIEKHMRVSCIIWNDIAQCYCLHYVPTVDEYTDAQRKAQEAQDIDAVMATLTRTDMTWYGYKKTEAAETTEAAEQPTEASTETTEQAATEAGKPKRIYKVYFTDNPRQPMTVQARTKREAEKAGRLYIRQWQLDAKIDRIERDDGSEQEYIPLF